MTGAFREFNEYMLGKFPLRINVTVREEKKKRERERESLIAQGSRRALGSMGAWYATVSRSFPRCARI